MNEQQPALAPELAPFEHIKRRDTNGYEYWLARDLAKLLGYSKWQHFEKRVIAEAMAICAREGEDMVALNFTRITTSPDDKGFDEVFTDSGKKPAEKRRQGGRRLVDFKLTRHACYIIAESADGRKDEVSWAKIYFALTTERYELLTQSEEDRVRIEQRQRIILYNVQLAMKAKQAGAITARQFALFFNYGYRGLYAGETAQDIHMRKGLAPHADILDYMGSLESAANAMRGALALHHMEQQQVSTLSAANRIHFKAGSDVREFLISQGVYPEQLPTPSKSYQQLVREQALRERLAAEDRVGLWALLPASDDGADESDEE